MHRGAWGALAATAGLAMAAAVPTTTAAQAGGATAPVTATTTLAERCTVSALQAAVAGPRGDAATLLQAADWVPAAPAQAASGPAPATPPVVAHCRVRALIGAHVGPPGRTAYGNHIQLRLPQAWNGRLVFQGGGGNNGVLGDALGLQRDGRLALNQGYAVLAQDSGHRGRDPHFALDAQAYRDFAHDGVHQATVLGKALIAAAAGQPPQRSYFVGCSNGGREALVTAQRHDDFDGVVAGAPGLAVYDQWLHNLHALQVVARVAGVPPGQVPQDTSGAYSDAQLAAVAGHFMRKCDALDGLADGLVQRPDACTADPADWRALSCAADGGSAPAGSCLRAAQVQGLKDIHDGARDSRGRLLWPGFHPGHIEGQMRLSYLGLAGSPRPVGAFYDSVMRNFVFMGYGHQGWPGASGPRDELASYPADSRAYVAGFDFDHEPARLQPGRLDFHGDNVDPGRPGPNFERFRQRGGRMLLYTGTMDNGVQPAGITGFMQRLQQQWGRAGADEVAALFLVPGMHHCRGGVATELFDPLAALVAWVEQGRRPERLEARAVPGGPLDRAGTGLSRPLCAWPRYARFNGQGDPSRADSFSCTAP